MNFRFFKAGKKWSETITAGFFIISAGIFLPLAAADNSTVSSKLIEEMKIPDQVQRIVDNYVSDTNSTWDLNSNREFLKIDPSIHACDITVGVPAHDFLLSGDKLENSNDTIPVDSLLIPIGRWLVPVYAKNKCIYTFEITNFTGPWMISSISTRLSKEWNNLRNAWPEGKNNDPIIITQGPEKYVHFPKIGRHNLSPLYGNSVNGKYVPRKFTALDSSKILIKELKSKRLIGKANRKYDKQ